MTEDLHHLAAAYSLDALDDDERDAFESHLPECERCRTEVAEFRETAGGLARAVADAPPDGLRGRILDEVAQTRQLPPQVPVASPTPARSTRRTGPLLAVAAVLVAIVVGAALFVARDDGRSELESVLAATDAVTLPLDGQSGSARVVWSPERAQAVLIAEGFADPGEGRVYELWAIVDGTPVPAGLFEPDEGAIESVVDLDPDALDASAWGITVEPAGGSTAPTGDILWFAEV